MMQSQRCENASVIDGQRKNNLEHYGKFVCFVGTLFHIEIVYSFRHVRINSNFNNGKQTFVI